MNEIKKKLTTAILRYQAKNKFDTTKNKFNAILNIPIENAESKSCTNCAKSCTNCVGFVQPSNKLCTYCENQSRWKQQQTENDDGSRILQQPTENDDGSRIFVPQMGANEEATVQRLHNNESIAQQLRDYESISQPIIIEHNDSLQLQLSYLQNQLVYLQNQLVNNTEIHEQQREEQKKQISQLQSILRKNKKDILIVASISITVVIAWVIIILKLIL